MLTHGPTIGDIPIIFSTVTGNAFKLAAAAKEVTDRAIGPYNIAYITDEFIEKYDTFILCYWCNRGHADDATIELINKMKNKNLIILGTLGAPREGQHALKVFEKVGELGSKENKLLGNYLCRGSIDPARSEEKRSIPKGQPRHLSEEGYNRHKGSWPHPTQEDLQGAKDAVLDALSCKE